MITNKDIISKYTASNLGAKDLLWFRKYSIHATTKPRLPVKKKKTKYQSIESGIVKNIC
jgi:hypothetical protein